MENQLNQQNNNIGNNILDNLPKSNIASPQEPPLIIHKKGIPSGFKAVVIMLVIITVVGGTFLVSRGVSSSAPIAPNAPLSQPKAFDPIEEEQIPIVIPAVTKFDPNGTIDCSKIPNTQPYGNRCVPVVILPNGQVDWAPGALEALTK